VSFLATVVSSRAWSDMKTAPHFCPLTSIRDAGLIRKTGEGNFP
jgi:hypothetical protein